MVTEIGVKRGSSVLHTNRWVLSKSSKSEGHQVTEKH